MCACVCVCVCKYSVEKGWAGPERRQQAPVTSRMQLSRWPGHKARERERERENEKKSRKKVGRCCFSVFFSRRRAPTEKAAGRRMFLRSVVTELLSTAGRLFFFGVFLSRRGSRRSAVSRLLRRRPCGNTQTHTQTFPKATHPWRPGKAMATVIGVRRLLRFSAHRPHSMTIR